MKNLIIAAAIAASSIAVAPETVQAAEIRFQIILGNEQDVRNLCRQYRYSKYNIVNGRKCSDFKPKAPRKKPNETVRSIQKLLNEIGFNAGTADGLYGRKTGNALTAFYNSIGQTYDGKADGEELAVLRDFVKNGAPQKSEPQQPKADVAENTGGFTPRWQLEEYAAKKSNVEPIKFVRGDNNGLGLLAGGWMSKDPALMNTAIIDLDNDGVAEVAYYASDECGSGTCMYQIAYYYDGSGAAGWKTVFRGFGGDELNLIKHDDRVHSLETTAQRVDWDGLRYATNEEGWDLLEGLRKMNYTGRRVTYDKDVVSERVLDKVFSANAFDTYPYDFMTSVRGTEYILKTNDPKYCEQLGDDQKCKFWLANNKNEIISEGIFTYGENIKFKPAPVEVQFMFEGSVPADPNSMRSKAIFRMYQGQPMILAASNGELVFADIQ